MKNILRIVFQKKINIILNSLKEKALYLFALFLPLEQLLFYVFNIDTQLKPYRLFLITAFTLSLLDKNFKIYKLTFVSKSFLFIFFYGLIIGLFRIGTINNGEITYLSNGAIHFLLGLMSFYLFTSITNIYTIYKIGNYFIIGALLSSLYGLFNFVLSPDETFRLRGFFNNPNHLAFALNYTSIFLFFKIKHEKKLKMNLFLIIYLSIIIFLSGSRSSLIIQVFLLFYFFFDLSKNSFKFLRNISLLAMLFILLVTPLLDVNNNFLNRFSQSNIETASGRLDLFKSALNLGVDTYFTGVGIGQYRFHHLKYLSSGSYETVTNFNLSTHNHYLDLLVNYGLISFLLYVGILILFYKTILKNRKIHINKFVLGLFLVLIVSSFSQEMLIFPIFWIVISILTYYTYGLK